MPQNIVAGSDSVADTPCYEELDVMTCTMPDFVPATVESHSAPDARTPSPHSHSEESQSVVLDLSCPGSRRASEDGENDDSQDSGIVQEKEDLNHPDPSPAVDNVMDAFIKYYEGMVAKRLLKNANLITLAEDLSTQLENILISTNPECVRCPKSRPDSPHPCGSPSKGSSEASTSSPPKPVASSEKTATEASCYAENCADLYEGRWPCNFTIDPSLEGAVGFDPVPGTSKSKPKPQKDHFRIQEEAAEIVFTGKATIIEALRQISNTLVDMMQVDRYAARDTAETVISSLEGALSMVRQGFPDNKKDHPAKTDSDSD